MFHILNCLQSRIYIFCGNFYVGNTQKPLKLVMEQHLQDVAQNVMHNNNTEYFSAHFAKHFT